MKIVTQVVVFLLCLGLLGACSRNTKQKEDPRFNRKIYLTEEDYLEDLNTEAAKERREAPPAEESEYIFNAIPETDKAVYFFDERQQPKIPGEPSKADYKREKRLWEKPKRYTPEQYYGMQGGADSSSSSSEESYDY